MVKKRVALSWSSGKDSAWVLTQLRNDPSVEVVALFTSLNGEFQRVAMHGVRRDLVEAQAEAAGLPIWIVELPWPCTNAQYEACMKTVWSRALDEQVDAIAFGDLFLEEIRQYRVNQLRDYPFELLFPAWDFPTDQLAKHMIAQGMRAKLSCIDPRKLPHSFSGSEFDDKLLASLPQAVDPCGENGEFHTFVYSAPCFAHDISVVTGETVELNGFVFTDIIRC